MANWLAYLVPHAATDEPIGDFATNVAIEVLTGLDFFAAFPDALESNLEARVTNPFCVTPGE